ncbi:MAG TPA: hypothetical protein VE959_35875 [Bryobacteraceae bacterium]|nr:hypothetical protein [Bryobacteraceae bacterium]
MKIFAVTLLPLLCAAAAGPDVDALIQAARAAPAEFSADALLRIASTDKVDKPGKIQLLEQAFERASGAQLPYKRRSALLRPDGQAGYWNRVYGQDMDVLSLRLRAVAAMLPLDGAKARELFLRIPPVRPPAVTCDEYLVYDLSRFYEVLGDLARQASDPASLLGRYMASMSSPEQVAPMAAVLVASGVSDRDFEDLLGSFTKALSKIGGDDRSFTHAGAIGSQIEKLVAEAQRRHVSPMLLLEAYRVYLVMNLSAARCADNDLMQGGRASFGLFTAQPVDQQADDYVTFFNTRLVIPPLQRIPEQEATPARLEGAATGLRFCQDVACQAIAADYRALVLNDAGSPLPPGDRTRPEWQAKLRAFLSSIAEWKRAPDVTPAEYFEQRSEVYRQFLGLAPDGPSREMVLRGLLDFTGQNAFQKASRLEWFLPVNSLIARLSLDPLGLGKLAGELRQSEDPLIALYANLEVLAPRPADRILPLL